jgi:hypothetical protein
MSNDNNSDTNEESEIIESTVEDSSKKRNGKNEEVASLQIHIYIFLIIFCIYVSWLPVLYLAGEYYRFIIQPNITIIANIFNEFNLKALIILLTAPIAVILLYILHLFFVALAVKIVYAWCNWISPRVEVVGITGVGKEEAKIVNYYHIRNVAIRLLKWSFNKSAFPQWYIWAANFVGTCDIHPSCVIEDGYWIHEFIEMHENSFIDRRSIAASHVVEGKIGAITIKKIIMEKNSGTGPFVALIPGNYLEEGSYMLPFSANIKFQRLKKGKYYDGLPVIRVPKSFVRKYFNFSKEDTESSQGDD